MATDSEVQRALNAGLFEPDTIESPADATGHFTAGQFSGTSLGANESGVIAELEIGADSPVSTSEAAVVGQFLGGDARVPGVGDAGDKFLAGNTRQARPSIDLELTGGGEPSGQVRVALKVSSEPTATGEPYAMQPRLESNVDTNQSDLSATEVEPLTPRESIHGRALDYGGDGDRILLVVLNGSTAQTFDVNDLEARIPILKWDGRMR